MCLLTHSNLKHKIYQIFFKEYILFLLVKCTYIYSIYTHIYINTYKHTIYIFILVSSLSSNGTPIEAKIFHKGLTAFGSVFRTPISRCKNNFLKLSSVVKVSAMVMPKMKWRNLIIIGAINVN